MRIFFIILLLLFSSLGVSAQFSVSGKIRTLRPVDFIVSDLSGKLLLQCQIENGKEIKSPEINITTDLYEIQIGASKQYVILDNKSVTLNGFLNDKDLQSSNIQFIGAPFDGKVEPTSNHPLALSAQIYKNKLQYELSYEPYRDAYDQGKELKLTSLLIQYIKNEADKRQLWAIGAKCPDFSFEDKNGKEVKLTDFYGKIVLLDFWASWCGPCRAEMKSLHKIYEEMKGDDLVFVSISLDDSKEVWCKAVDEDTIPWVSVWEKAGFKKSTYKDIYGFKSIPFIMLIDKDGLLVARKIRGNEVKNQIIDLRKK